MHQLLYCSVESRSLTEKGLVPVSHPGKRGKHCLLEKSAVSPSCSSMEVEAPRLGENLLKVKGLSPLFNLHG